MALDLDTLRRTPAYPFPEAAHYLRLPRSTLRAWCVGPGNLRSLIRLDGRPTDGLSFLNLVEAHVLAAIRRVHQLPLPKVRKSLDFVAKSLGVARPLADAQFHTNGVDLFVHHFGQLVNVSKQGQVELETLMRAHPRRIERDPRGVPIKLYPFTRKGAEAAVDEPAPVEMDPRIAFGRPVLVGRGVPTAVLADRFKAGDTMTELAADFDVELVAIEEALRCELDHRAA